MAELPIYMKLVEPGFVPPELSRPRRGISPTQYYDDSLIGKFNKAFGPRDGPVRLRRFLELSAKAGFLEKREINENMAAFVRR